MRLKEMLKFMFFLICVITTAQIVAQSLRYGVDYMITGDLWTWPVYWHYRYLLAAVISVLPSLIFINSDETSRVGFNIRIGIHFLLTFSFTMGAQVHFFCDWSGWRALLTSAFFYFFLSFSILSYLYHCHCYLLSSTKEVK